ncbi:MAG: transcriptional repressor LexA [Actinomycetaceae bacterium]|nr:transcriptional repressor LexA [Arcanobacterium sp.]MDD7687344.1 transcriptional repressor LexA [Actinomycetaceae bacterium]MDY5274113.1 transcriptional repressor LexA [Arcanobacterium sp.]
MQRALSLNLTDRQLRILGTIRAGISERGFPPTVREIATTVGLSSPSSVQYQLGLLEKAGLIQRNSHRSRTIEVTERGNQLDLETGRLKAETAAPVPPIMAPATPTTADISTAADQAIETLSHTARAISDAAAHGYADDLDAEWASLSTHDTLSTHNAPGHPSAGYRHAGNNGDRHLSSIIHNIDAATSTNDDYYADNTSYTDDAYRYEKNPTDTVFAPLVGTIAAGTPILAEQHIEEEFPLPRQLTGSGELFVLRVQGESMIDAAICDGDYVVVRQQPVAEQGEIVAAMIEGEATVKVLKKKDGHVWLLPRNDAYDPIPADNARILGRVVCVLRSL